MTDVFSGYTFDLFVEACYLAVAKGFEVAPPGNAQHYTATRISYQKSFPALPWEALRDEALSLPKGEAFRRYSAAS